MSSASASAPSSPSSPSTPTRQQALLAAAAPLETGTTINEHYTQAEYAVRRGRFLLRTLPSGAEPFSRARRDAAELWAGRDDASAALSVQAVRRLELAAEMAPLLPLPTTANTATADGYAQYPGREWTPGAEPVGVRADTPVSSPPPERAGASGSSTPASVGERPVIGVPGGASTTPPSSPPPQATKAAPAEKHARPDGEPVGDDRTDESAVPGAAAASPRKRGRSPSAEEEGDGDITRARAAKKPRLTKAPRKKPAAVDAAVLAAVMDGEALPASIAEARAASKALLERLTEEFRASLPPPRKGLAVRKGRKDVFPDFRPEFARAVNFDKGDETVRCVCGAGEDDGEHMVGCDGCGVWQHVGCMGEAVQEDVEDDETEYLCQGCDPWGHRVLLQGLRAERAAVEAAVAEE
ncbi:hypothetical protein MBLNU230_g3937t1 [Neophaeotheca triangularis]